MNEVMSYVLAVWASPVYAVIGFRDLGRHRVLAIQVGPAQASDAGH
jgi:hypothetical protein